MLKMQIAVSQKHHIEHCGLIIVNLKYDSIALQHQSLMILKKYPPEIKSNQIYL